MKKKLLVLITLLISAFILVGCGSEINMYYYTDGSINHYQLELKMSKTDLTLLSMSSSESGASHTSFYLPEYDEQEGNWTFEQYIKTLFEYRTDFDYQETAESNTEISYYFTLEIPSEEDEIETESKMKIDKNLFMYTVTVTQDNPFNGYRKAYNEAEGSGKSFTAVDVMQNGWKEYTSTDDPEKINELLSKGWTKSPESNIYERRLMPSFAEAFPITKDKSLFNEDKLKLNYILPTTSKLSTSGEVFTDTLGNKYYLWKTLFTEDDTQIIYQYKRANSVGWNIMSIVIGFAVVGSLLIYCKYFYKQKPKKTSAIARAKELFPYDPSDNSNNPFSGY